MSVYEPAVNTSHAEVSRWPKLCCINTDEKQTNWCKSPAYCRPISVVPAGARGQDTISTTELVEVPQPMRVTVPAETAPRMKSMA
jgi:hypothetical protein